MSGANIIRGEFFEGSDVRIMARVVRHDNVVLAPADCAGGTVHTMTVYDLNAADPSAAIYTAGTVTGSLVFTVGTVSGWTADSIGANFLWTAKVGSSQVWSSNTAVIGGHRYRFEAKILTTSFGTIVVVAELSCKTVFSA